MNEELIRPDKGQAAIAIRLVNKDGFETFAKGELIATDGDEEIRAPIDDCTIFMPTRQPIVGREGVYLTRPMR